MGRSISPPRRATARPSPWDAVAAVSLLTILPVPPRAQRAPAAVTVAAFGATGLLLGGAVAGLDAALAPALTVPVRSAVELAALAAASGAVHLDGLADAADGLFLAAPRGGAGGGAAARRLDVMREGRIGAFGAAALVLVLLLDWAALAALQSGRLQAVTAAVGVSRAAAGLALAGEPARSDGLARRYARPRRGLAAGVGAAATTATAVWLSGVRGGAAGLAGAVAALAVAVIFARRVGGITGDGCGAAAELALAAALVTLGART